MRASAKAYYEKHKEEIKARALAYKADRREHYTQLQKEWAKKNPVAAKSIDKRSREKNKEKVRRRKADWYKRNAERIKAKQKDRYQNTPGYREKVLASQKTEKARERARVSKRKSECRVRFNKSRNARLAVDLNFKIRSRLGSRLSTAIRLGKGVKSARTLELIGCTVEFLKNHLESLFTEGMTWEAFNRGDIHIDHKKPCVSFDLTKPEQQRECFFWKNLQPLWAFDNLSKHGKMVLTISGCEVNEGKLLTLST